MSRSTCPVSLFFKKEASLVAERRLAQATPKEEKYVRSS